MENDPSLTGAARTAALLHADMIEAMMGTMRQPLLVLNHALCVELANPAFYSAFGVSEGVTLGRKIYDLGNGQWNIAALRDLLERILPHDGEVVDFRVAHDFQTIGPKVMLLNAFRMARKGGDDLILLGFEDVTARERDRDALEGDREFIAKIFDASRDALLVLGYDLRVRMANETFYSLFRSGPADTIGQPVYELGNGQWDIPRLRDLLGTILPGEASFDDFAVEHDFADLGPRTMVLNARRIDHLQYILLAIQDQTDANRAALARRTAEDALRQSVEKQEFLLRLSDSLSPLADPVAVEEQACKLLVAHLGVDRAFCLHTGLAAGTARVLSDQRRGDLASLAGQHRCADFGWPVETLRRGECHVIPDTQASPLLAEKDRRALAAMGILACAGVPGFRDGTLTGALCVTQSRPRHWTEAEIDLLREAATRIWSAVQAARADGKRRESDARLAAIFKEASVGLCEIDRNGRFLRANNELARIVGRPLDAFARLTVADVTHPDDLEASRQMMAHTLQGRTEVSDAGIDKRYLRPDGTEVWANSRASLVPGPDGSQGTLLVVTVDLTRRKKAEAEIRASEERFRQFGEASSDALWIWNSQNRSFEYASAATEKIIGIAPDAIMASEGFDMLLDLIHPDDRAATDDAFRTLCDGPKVFDFRLHHPQDGSLHWLRTTGFALKGSEPVAHRLGGITQDMTDMLRTAERMKVLMAELQHRTRNLIGVVQAMSARTLRTSTSLADYSQRFSSRLEALARVNGLLSRLEDGSRITFDALLAEEFKAHGVSDRGEQVTLTGPKDIRLPSASVQTLALALHELLTNASKYGALSTPQGRLAVDWELQTRPKPKLRLSWRETGLPPDSTAKTDPRPGGYGRELIERALPYQLGAETDYRLDAHGLNCTVSLPLSNWKTDSAPG